MIAAYINKTPEEVALATTFNALKVNVAVQLSTLFDLHKVYLIPRLVK